MRIVHVNYVFEGGDTPDEMIVRYRTLRRVAEAQAKAGHDVYILSRSHTYADISRNEVRWVFREDNTRQPVAQPWTYPKDIHGIAVDLDPDILHIHSLKFHPQVRMLRTEIGENNPILVQHHAERPRPKPLSYLQRCCLEAADGFLFTGRASAHTWIEAGIIPGKEKVYEVPEGSADFGGDIPEHTPRILHGNPIVLWVGRMVATKDPVTLLEGFRIVAREHADIRLYMIYRDGPIKEEICNRIEESPLLQQTVTLLGERSYESLPEYYASADIFLTGAPYEGSNYALIEALHCGAFPVCSSISPHRYLTQNGTYAEYFPPGNAAACASALERALERYSRLPRSRIITYAQSTLSFDAIAQTLEGIYVTVQNAVREAL